MLSINLLPKNIKSKKDKSERNTIFALLSVFLIVIPVIFYIVIYVNNITAANESESLDNQIEKIDSDIKKEIDKERLKIESGKLENVMYLLNNHHYFFRAFKVIQNTINDDVYLKEIKFSINDENDKVILKVRGKAESYLSVVNQIAAFKNYYWIEDVNIKSISTSEGNEVKFDGEMTLKKNVILYHERYWDFGMDLIYSKAGKNVEINEYSADLVDNGENIVKVKFSGAAYDEKELIFFENGLKDLSDIIKEAHISYDLNNKEKSGKIKFEGEAIFNL